jgi:hypothetical protein
MTTDDVYLSGARRIIQTCLGMTSAQNLVIFVDETTHEVDTV